MNHEQSFSGGTPDSRVKPLVSNSAWSQEMGTAPPLASLSHLNAVTAKGALDLWHKLQLW